MNTYDVYFTEPHRNGYKLNKKQTVLTSGVERAIYLVQRENKKAEIQQVIKRSTVTLVDETLPEVV